MAQGAAEWFVKKPFVLAVLGTSLTAGRLSGNLWWQRLMVDARAQPEAVGPVIMQNYGKGSQQSPYGVAMAPEMAGTNPTHILSEGFAINDSAAALGVVTRAQHTDNMAAMRATWKAKNPAVDVTWQVMNPVSAAGQALRPALVDYYADEVTFANTNGDGLIDHYNGLSPAAPPGGWPKPMPDWMTDNGDGLHPIWDNALSLYMYPALIFWLRQKMAAFWELPAPNPPEPPALPNSDFLFIGGGGAGGGSYSSGGGGAGGVKRNKDDLTNLIGAAYVGRFGGAAGSNTWPGGSGESTGVQPASGRETNKTLGGGGGGTTNGLQADNLGRDGGSGGGGGGTNAGPIAGAGGGGILGQGFQGGPAFTVGSNGSGGGGGGARGVGGGPAPNNSTSMPGGVGYLVDVPGWTSPAMYVGGGGPAGCYNVAPQPYPSGGGPFNYGGGGRGSLNGGNTGSERGANGLMWIWYPGPKLVHGNCVTVQVAGGFTVHYFTRDSYTNYLVRSQEIGVNPWTADRVTFTANQINAPDNTLTADLITVTAGQTWAVAFQYMPAPFPPNNGEYCFSIYLKRGPSNPNYSLIAYDLNASQGGYSLYVAQVNWQTNPPTVTPLDNSPQVGIETAYNGWWRVWVAGRNGGSVAAPVNPRVLIYPTAGNAPTVAGGDVYAWGGQFVLNPWPLNYVQTQAAQVAFPAHFDRDLTNVNAPLGELIATTTEFDATYAGWKAFQGPEISPLTGWASAANAASPQAIQRIYQTPRRYVGYRMQAMEHGGVGTAGYAQQCPKGWNVYGTTDGGAYTLIDQRIDQPAWASREERFYNINLPGLFKAYYFEFVAMQGNDRNIVHVGRIELLPGLELGATRQDLGAPDPTIEAPLGMVQVGGVGGAWGAVLDPLAEFPPWVGTPTPAPPGPP